MKKKIIPKNRGQELLIATGLSLTKIANGLGCSGPGVGNWRNGVTLPQKKLREKLRDVYGIPVASWDQPPDGIPEEPTGAPAARERASPAPETDSPIQPAQSKLPPYPEPPKNGSTLDGARHSLACIRHDLEFRPLTAAARSKVRGDEMRTLALISKLEEREDLTEDRYVRDHPAWDRLCDAIMESLEPYPEAYKAVLEAIGDVLEGENV